MVSNIFYFHPYLQRVPFWRAYFSKGLVQPPTSERFNSFLGDAIPPVITRFGWDASSLTDRPLALVLPVGKAREAVGRQGAKEPKESSKSRGSRYCFTLDVQIIGRFEGDHIYKRFFGFGHILWVRTSMKDKPSPPSEVGRKTKNSAMFWWENVTCGVFRSYDFFGGLLGAHFCWEKYFTDIKMGHNQILEWFPVPLSSMVKGNPVISTKGSLVELVTGDYITAKRQICETINFNILDACKSGL